MCFHSKDEKQTTPSFGQIELLVSSSLSGIETASLNIHGSSKFIFLCHPKVYSFFLHQVFKPMKICCS